MSNVFSIFSRHGDALVQKMQKHERAENWLKPEFTPPMEDLRSFPTEPKLNLTR